jgi:helicase required for RNAi-mediated heterochromatin assembly 1
MPHNRASGLFPSLEAYLATHFTLLREDCIAALRKGLLALHDGRNVREESSACSLYLRARVVNCAFARRGVGWRMRFEMPPGRRRQVSARSLLTGSLLCLVATDDVEWNDLTFATVIQRNDELLADAQGPVIDIEEAAAPDAPACLNSSRTYTMVESGAYFEAYRPVLEALLCYSRNRTAVPFVDNLLGATDALPLRAVPGSTVAAADGRLQVRLDEAFPGNEALAPLVADAVADPWPNVRHSLNASQLTAVQLALRHRLSLIQGPPGCGKTFVGVLLTKLLLANSALSGGRPLLFVCYTNHALDQLLEHVVEFEPKVVRVGGRSQSEKLVDHTLASWRIHTKSSTPETRRINKAFAIATS